MKNDKKEEEMQLTAKERIKEFIEDMKIDIKENGRDILFSLLEKVFSCFAIAILNIVMILATLSALGKYYTLFSDAFEVKDFINFHDDTSLLVMLNFQVSIILIAIFIFLVFKINKILYKLFRS